MGQLSRVASVGYSAEPFVVLDENRFAYSAVKRLSTGRFRSVSPLVYLYGPSGVGKSHLAHRFLRAVQRQSPSTRTAILTVGDLESDPSHREIRKSDVSFQDKAAPADILVFEGLDQLEDQPEQLQRRLITLLDAVRRSDGRCLLTSQKPPGQFHALLPRLVNRCRAGVSAPIRFPAEASRAVLIEHFTQRRQIPLCSETIRHLAKSLSGSPRELQAALIQLETGARDENRPIDLAFTCRVLKCNPQPDTLTLPQIAEAVSRQFGVPLSGLRAPRRQRTYVTARQSAMLLARELTEHSLSEIADYFGRRNHKTVLYACRRLTQTLSENPQLRRNLAELRRTLNPAESDSC